ncbi:MAG: PhoU family transcriptional regulator [Candidatus Abyssobacteria bacterium SURF_17]|uniref:PhoU family transcriptional regulator n=1 Tax=Candidatus Abyssobacteria bacterium SURF_17 TaxID=2093361 RepID=A0A419F6R4_9BACT|nr:MAG: PhoU family transcriptional regulator [Candidatus Abyssubacteria bacterium SURF_17]
MDAAPPILENETPLGYNERAVSLGGYETMLKELLDMLRAKSPLRDMLNEFTQMIEKTEWMFDASIKVLLHSRPTQEVEKEIYSKDKEVNEHQRSIRRKIIRHLTFQPRADVPACLVLMSVVKDAERVGDYCKNLFELATMFDIPLDRGRYKTPLKDLAEQVENLFSKTRKAFQWSDEEMAHSIIAKSEAINDQCDMLIRQLITDNLPTKKAVAYTLLARYIKRVASHLNNIATSVVTSVDNLDFSDESKDPHEQE